MNVKAVLSKGVLVLALATPFAFASGPERVQAQAAEHAVVELWETLLPLGSVNSFMNTGAHPDDERSSLLARLSRGEGAHVVSVTANRGEGGQNAIGTQYEDALGALRSREMEEASRAFGVDLYFLSEGAGDRGTDAAGASGDDGCGSGDVHVPDPRSRSDGADSEVGGALGDEDRGTGHQHPVVLGPGDLEAAARHVDAIGRAARGVVGQRRGHHHGAGAGILGDAGVLGGDDVHDDAALEHLGQATLDREGARGAGV